MYICRAFACTTAGELLVINAKDMAAEQCYKLSNVLVNELLLSSSLLLTYLLTYLITIITITLTIIFDNKLVIAFFQPISIHPRPCIFSSRGVFRRGLVCLAAAHDALVTGSSDGAIRVWHHPYAEAALQV